MKRSTSGTCRRISSIARWRYGSSSPSRKRSSPCSVQQIGRFSASPSGRARPMSSEFGRLMTSGTGSSASQSSSLSNSFRSTPRRPFEHRDRQIAEQLRIGGERTARERLDDARGIPPPIQKARRVPEQRQALLQVDADPAKQDLIAADVDFVGVRGRIERKEGDLVTARQELDRQRVVPRTAPAVHPRGAGGDREDPHGRLRASRAGRAGRAGGTARVNTSVGSAKSRL